MKLKSFRYCMLIGALALTSLALYYFSRYIVLAIALNNNDLQPDLEHSIRAMWLAFACQALLIGALYALVAWKPHAVSREVIIILGMLQMVEAVLLFSFSGSGIAAALLTGAALFVLVGSMLWPKRLPAASASGADGT
jgi:hypothetical protein